MARPSSLPKVKLEFQELFSFHFWERDWAENSQISCLRLSEL